MRFKRFLSGGSVLLVVALFGAVNIIGNTLVTSWRLDLTANRSFTLSQGTLDLIEELPDRGPIELRLYVSRSQITGIPRLNIYASRVQDLLREYASRSRGKLRLTVIEPEPFSEEEDEAVQDGLQGIQVDNSGGLAYLGLSGVNDTDDRAVLPFFSPSREDSLEYEVSKLVHKLSEPKRVTVGVLTTLPLFPGIGQRTQEKPWTIITHLRELMEVRELNLGTSRIDPEVIDVLMVVHPKDMPGLTVYAIDQYLLGGGKLLLLVDPLSETDTAEQATGNVLPNFSSNLPQLLKNWGLELAENKVVGDLKYAMRVQVSSPQGQRESPYPPWLRLDPGKQGTQKTDDDETAEDFVLNYKDFSLNGIKLLQFGTAGALLRNELPESLQFTPLVQSSQQAGLLERDLILLQRDPKILLQNLQNAADRYVLAARLQGHAPSAFPDGPPVPEAEEDAPEAPQPEDPQQSEPHRSEGPVNAVLIADTDLLRDLFWYRQQSLGTLVLNQEISDNANFLIKTIDHLSGSSALLKLSPRRIYARTFSRVEEIRRAAEEEYRSEEELLRNALAETEQKLRELQSQQSSEGGAILSTAQARELEGFKLAQVKTRKQLRAVQHQLRKNIEGLGARLKLINIGLFPALILLLAVLIGYLRTNSPGRAARKGANPQKARGQA